MTDPRGPAEGSGPHDASETATIGESSRSPAAHALRSGATFGHYRIERLLGRGGMGEVYAAEDCDSGRRLALKLLIPGSVSESNRARFLREGRLAASVSHPNVVYVFGTEEIEGTPVIAMELIAGGNMKEHVAAYGPVATGKAVEITLQMIAGLEPAAAAGVLHRDIKPSNCFMDDDGSIKVGDFGLSISTLTHEGDVTRGSTLTRSGTLLGTPAFASPEQLRGQALDVRSDIYSVCATLYYLLTGRAPFEGANVVDLIAKVTQDAPLSPRAISGGVPSGLAACVLRGLSKRPEQRFASYAALASALAVFRPIALTPASLGVRAFAGALDHAALVPVVTAAAMLLVLVLGATGVAANRTALSLAVTFAVTVLYFGISEGKWGASLGKAIGGLEVIEVDGHRPRFHLAFARATLYWTALHGTVTAVLFVVPRLDAGDIAARQGRAQIATAVVGISLALLFSTARSRNGFAGIHEVLTRTRVVRHATRWAARDFAHPPRERPAGLSSEASRLGPYHVVADFGGGFYGGYDLVLRRDVWVWTSRAGTDLIDSRRRLLNRPTRLRWLAGGVSNQERWDAFEAPAGEALTLLPHAQPWVLVREWLRDLASEVASGIGDGSLPHLGVDRVWVSPTGRAWLLEFPAPLTARGEIDGTNESGYDFVAAQRFLYDVAERALTGARGPKGVSLLPAHARRDLNQLRDGLLSEPDELRSLASAVVRGPATVSRGRRIVQLALPVIPMLWLLASAAPMLAALSRKGVLEGAEVMGFIGREIVLPALMFVGAISTFCAVVFRDGPSFRALRIAIVTADGRPVSRWRALWRAMTTWAPIWLLSIGIVNDSALLLTPGVSAFLRGPVPEPVLLALLIGGVAVAVLTPERGAADRLAGTYLVPATSR